MSFNFETTYTALPPTFFREVSENRVKESQIILWNKRLAEELDVEDEYANTALFAGAQPRDYITQAYAGHQFGNFTMLGDGRAMLIGEHVHQNKRVDVQLKGSGRTPYSRGGDGRARIGPMVREYIISEAMNGLRIPTTRSLAVTTTGLPVYREEVQQGAVLTRIAASHLRVGTFQYARHMVDEHAVRELADYAMARHYASLEKGDYIGFFRAVMRRQAQLIAQWQLVGFVHGVMNTDNMTISGETIDYGPCAFLDVFHADQFFSSIDQQGRYRYSQQPAIGGWNLTRFAETLLPLIDDNEEVAIAALEEVLMTYPQVFGDAWLAGMRDKLGLATARMEDRNLAEQLLSWMEANQADFTETFRALSEGKAITGLAEWQKQWEKRLEIEGTTVEAAQQCMRRVNPAIIARNYYVEAAIQDAEAGNMDAVEMLVEALQNPYEVKETHQHFRTPPTMQNPYVTYCGT